MNSFDYSLRLSATTSLQRSRFVHAALGLALLLTGSSAHAGESLIVLPARVALHGANARQQILVERAVDDRFVGQVTDPIAYSSSDPQVAAVQGDQLIPKANGTATIRAQVGELFAEAEVKVTGMQDVPQWSFRNHVQSVLYKAGCSAGACHGALAGKGGFRLSLRGYDTETDYATITRQARGRRIELADPGRSLILAKPSGAIAHKGGLRFETGSLDYRVLAEWIAAGVPRPRDDDPRLSHLEVIPAQVELRPGDSQQILVRAHFSDGRAEEVTRWVKFTSTNEAVAKVDDNGRVAILGHGAGAVTGWYLSQIAVARLTVPYDNQVPPAAYLEAPRRNFIDQLVLEKLQSLRLPPSPRSADAEFLRRAYLDTIGMLPQPDEVRSFLQSEVPDKRDRLIDQLLGRPEFVDYWTYKWSDVLLVTGKRLRPDARAAYYDWIHQQVASNTPWDEFARQIVTASGSSIDQGATNFYALHQMPEDMNENISQSFLGLSIACAKCHNHPLEKWTNNQYYAMANIFARVRAKGWGGDGRSGDGRRTVYVAPRGDLIQPLTGKAQPPAPLDGEVIDADSPLDRRIHLAAWLTAPENPYFRRAITNRIWANFFGVGLVEAVDDMRLSNPASNEQLLESASAYLVKHDFDVKALMRAILQSETYQRTSRPVPGNETENRFYSRYYRPAI